MTEKQTQAAVKRLYRDIGAVCYDTSQPFRAKITPGVPDLLVFLPRKQEFWMHEVKSPTGKQSPAQHLFESACILSAIPYVCGGVDAALAHLKAIGVVAT